MSKINPLDVLKKQKAEKETAGVVGNGGNLSDPTKCPACGHVMDRAESMGVPVRTCLPCNVVVPYVED